MRSIRAADPERLESEIGLNIWMNMEAANGLAVLL